MEQDAPTTGDESGRAVAGVGIGNLERGNDVPEDEYAARDRRRTPLAEAATSDTAVDVERPSLRRRLRTTLDLIRANPTGRIALKGFVALAGALVVALGLALIPLPGPGWLIVIGGLGIWAVEFHWAKRLLNFTRRNVRAWTRWVTRQSWPVRLLIGTVGLIFVGVVVWLSLKYSLGIDVVARVLAYLATH
ncbi:TIGR02611 family protein [Micromonospora sonneratiae]|uniref:TIGR02611 family protein n=1 Tax=Micromonospora sonneratiae TaxID=1184706 RepID=A0ABW3Y982_9ACTN